MTGDTRNVSGSYATTGNNLIAGQATGLNALITGPTEGTITFSTTGAFANALQADSGGAIMLTPTADNPGTVTTTSNNSIGLYATGSASSEEGPVASSITVQNLNITTLGNFANGVQADTGGQVTLTGGSVIVSGTQSFDLNANGIGTQIQANGLASTSSVNNWTAVQADTVSSVSYTGSSITTTGNSALNVLAIHGSSITLSGTTITANGNGTGALSVGDCCSSTPDSGASITGNGLTIISTGTTDPSTGYNSDFANNPNGGTLMLSNSTLTASGDYNFGVSTAKTSVTTLTNDTISSTGANATGVSSYMGGHTTINGGSVTMSGDGSTAISIDGAGSMLQATGVAVTTNGAANPSESSYVNGLSVSNGGAATFTGGSITANGASNIALSLYSTGAGATVNLPGGTTILTTGPGATGVNLNGPNTSLTATGLIVTTQGGIDPSDGYSALGFYNNGGTLNLTQPTVTTTGQSASGVVTAGGGTTTISGGSVTTSGDYSLGLQSTAAGSSITTTNLEEIGPVTITTSGS